MMFNRRMSLDLAKNSSQTVCGLTHGFTRYSLYSIKIPMLWPSVSPLQNQNSTYLAGMLGWLFEIMHAKHFVQVWHVGNKLLGINKKQMSYGKCRLLMKTCLVLPQASSHTIPHTRQLQQLHFILPTCHALVHLTICPGCSLHLSVTTPKVSFYLVFRAWVFPP